MKLTKIAAVLFGAAMFSTGVAADTLKKIAETGKIVMGVRDSSAPLSYTLGNGQYVGYHVELCQRVIEDIKKELKKPVTVEYVAVTSQNRIPLVQNGTVDIECGSTTNNATRQKDVSFGPTTFVTEVRTAVKANSGITSISQLNGRNIATTTGTTSVQHLRKHERGNSIDFKEVYGKDHAESFLLLESGRADAFVMDDNILAGLIANSKAPADFRIVGEVLSIEPIAVMYRKDDPAFRKLVDDSIRAQMKSGAVDGLYTKWFKSPIPPKNSNVGLPMGATLKSLISAPNDNPMEAYAKK